MDINQFILDGNLTRAPEVRYTTSGMPICTFTVASHSVQGSGEDRRERTAFIPISTIGKLADDCYRKLRKGAAVTVMGRLDSWSNADSKKSGFTFAADQVIHRHRAPRATQSDAPTADAAAQAATAQQSVVADSNECWLQEFEAAWQSLAQAH